ncbi:MAG: SdrD B-like domain-containing protein [Acidimicrobiia bacterium]|nr:SdrD B-like domain-containing protein [Acidimicrobiia bacterium]
MSADFGYNGTGGIGDFVWLDLNADGVQDPLEPGIPDVDLEITWYGGDGLLGTADDAVVNTATDLDGNYSVSDLPGGNYDVAVVAVSLPTGVAQTYDSDGLASPHVASLLLGGGSTDSDQDFGYNGGATVGDTVWFDRNGDGVFDLAEYGIAGVDVEVIWAGPDAIHATADDETFPHVTDASGEYEATNLPPGEYAVVVLAPSLPAGMVPTYDLDGALDGQTLFSLGQLEQQRAADFGYRGTGDIGDSVWLDSDGDGVQAPGEPVIPAQGVVLTAAGADGVLGTGDDETYQATTDSLGVYTFTGLPPGDYEVEVVGPITVAAVNTYDEDGGLDSRSSLTLGDGVSHATADFGYVGSAEIGDFVWLDLDADGAAGPAEPGFPGVEITLTWLGDDGTSGGGDDVVVGIVTSDASGAYGVTGLPAGEYDVLVSGGVPAGYVIGSEGDGGSDGRMDVSVVAGAVDHTIDFGYRGTGSVGDTIWWDLDSDGTRNVRENGLNGVDVTITWDGFDATPETPDDQSYDVTTDPDGAYLVTDLPPGGYSVVVDVTDLPPGLVQSYDPDGLLDAATTATVGPHAAELGLDFGFRGNGSVSGAIWYDVNFDGLHAPYEPGVTGVELSVTYFGPDDTAGTGDDVVFDVFAAVDGTYELPGLPSGFFEVVVDEASLPTGVSLFSDQDGGDPTTTALTVGASSAVVGVDFLAMGDASLTGVVWNDRNGDGVMDPEEVGVSTVGLSVSWEHLSGPVPLEVETDAAGRWELENLPPGVYSADLDLATLPVGMSPTTTPTLPAVLAGGGEAELGFGVALMLNVGSRVWIDSNSDGIPDEGEEGIAGVTVNLYDELGGLLAMVETGSDGAYTFGDLYPGVYSVQVEFLSVPNNLHPTHDRDGTADLLTSVDLTEGEHVLDANFGFQVALPNTGLDLDVLTIWGLIITLFGAAMVATARASTERQFTASAAAAS